MSASLGSKPHNHRKPQPKRGELPVESPGTLSSPLRQEPLASTLGPDDNRLPITDTERALFAACFGKIIDQILAEPD